ncbi:MAG: hypothetical protein A2086_03385 [Spirochaetes bacterium GWD1_27_9]|nr:MAG: hypothetical protein A2Y34_14410 [Spirochaetes bacterium GWC1_27_15]OHD45218.1 MAG: hypothetical protein A2086_03385 [Spirochaetes bacterium GWD1_27_9]
MNNKINMTLVFFMLLFIFNINAEDKKKDVKINQGAEPAWIKKFPSNPMYYIGIATGSTMQQSQDAALNSIASQIKVKVQSEITDMMKEKNGITEEQVEQNVKLSVKQNIEDVEVIEIWYSPEKGYWAYYRLDIEKYKRKQQEKMENAKKIALDYLTKCDNEQDQALAFKYAFLGYFNVGVYIANSLKVNYKGQEVFIVNELVSRMQKILSGIAINPVNSQIEIAKINPKAVEIQFNVTSNGKPLVNFPLTFKTNKGELDLTQRSTTDSNGKVSCILNKAIKRDIVQSFIATLDLMSFIQGATDDEEEAIIFFGRLSNLGIPSKEVMVNVVLPVLSFNLELLSDLANNKQYKARFDTLATNFKDEFVSLTGTKIADNGAVLKLNMVIEGSITQSSTSGQFFTKILVTVSIIDIAKNEELFSSSTQEIKGGSVTELKSVQAAIDKYTKDFNKKLVKKVLDYMEGK